MAAFAPLLLSTVLKGTVVLAMALVLAAALRRASGLARHRLWSLAFAALLLLPALVTALPPLPLPVPSPLAKLGSALTSNSSARARAFDSAQARRDDAPTSAERDGPAGRQEKRSTKSNDPTSAQAFAGRRATEPGTAREHASASAPMTASATASTPRQESGVTSLIGRHGPTTLLVVWLAGVAAGLVFLLAGVARAAWHARRARPVDDQDWLHDLEWHRNFFGIRRRVRLLESDRVRTPMTGGALRPMVLVPPGATTWSAERRRLVLLHELVHIRRWDVVRHWLARVGVALYWFHPLAWIAARSSSVAREQACDEEVLRLGVKPSVYARQLFELAQGLHSGRIPAAALPMIQRSQLSILRRGRARRAPRPWRRCSWCSRRCRRRWPCRRKSWRRQRSPAPSRPPRCRWRALSRPLRRRAPPAGPTVRGAAGSASRAASPPATTAARAASTPSAPPTASASCSSGSTTCACACGQAATSR